MGLQYRKGVCCECPEDAPEEYIVKRIGADGYCHKHNQKRLAARRGPKVYKPLKQRTPLKRTKLNYKRKPTGERALFEAIWASRARVSFLDNKKLGDDAYAWFFAHVLRKAKGHYPDFKLYDKNIILLTRSQHEKYDNNVRSPELLIEKDPRWQKVFDLRDQLLKEYGELNL